MDRDYHQSLGEFYNLKDEIEMKRNTEQHDGEVSADTDTKHRQITDYAALMTEIRDAEREASPEKQRTREFEPYILGLAREALGKKPLEGYPNPLIEDNLPKPVDKVVKQYMADLKELGYGRTKDPSPDNGIDDTRPLGKPREGSNLLQRTKEYNAKRLGAKETYKGLMKRKQP